MTLIDKRRKKLLFTPKESGCYFDATELYGLSGDDALSAALSCNAEHSGDNLIYYKGFLFIVEDYFGN